MDDDDVTWSFAYTFELEADKSNIKTKYQASANNNRQLLCFQGPDLYAGEGSFGSSKDLAIFPGLEYLEAGEQSSSTRDMANFITQTVCMDLMVDHTNYDESFNSDEDVE